MGQTTKPAHDAAQCDGLASGTGCSVKGQNLGDDSLKARESIPWPFLSLFLPMANLSRFLLIDKVSGTVLCADQCYLVDDDSLSLDQWEAMESMSDSEIGNLAINHGRKLSDVVTLRPILPGESA
jgi:hypothetical protein